MHAHARCRGCSAGSSHGVRGCLQPPIERMAFERIAELQIDVEHGIASVAAELFETGRMAAARHAGAQRAALEAVAAELPGVETGAGGEGLGDLSHGVGVNHDGADAGQGVLRPPRPRGGFQIRRNAAPAAIPAVSYQARSARIGQRSVVA
jgi:hypothetical protein